MEEKQSLWIKIKKSDKLALIIALLVMVIVFTVLKPSFLTYNNLINILVASSIVGLVAVGETFLMIAGQIDMSPGSVSAFSGVLAALLLKQGVPAAVTILIVLVMGALIGTLNATLVVRLEINFFIATLATQSIFRGLAYIICGGKSIAVTNPAFLKIGITNVFGIPLPVIIFLLVIIVFGIILARTRFGKSVYMIGGNRVAARLAGIQGKKNTTLLFILSSMLAALGGAILASRMNSGQPSASEGLEFDAVTGVVLGGVAMSGGIGTMGGVAIGLMIMQGFANGLQVLNVQSFWQKVAKGLLLIAALSFDYLRSKQREKGALKSMNK